MIDWQCQLIQILTQLRLTVLFSGYIQECNPDKFSATVVNPLAGTMGVERVKGSTRVHVEGMTCGECVHYKETKMRAVKGILDITVSME